MLVVARRGTRPDMTVSAPSFAGHLTDCSSQSIPYGMKPWLSSLLLVGCATNAAEDASQSSTAPKELPLLCPECERDRDPTAFDREPPVCEGERRDISADGARELGFDVDYLEQRLQATFSAPVEWRSAGSRTTLHAGIELGSFRFAEHAVETSSGCGDALEFGLTIAISANDGSIAGTLVTTSQLVERGEIREPFWLGSYAWPAELRGSIELQTGALGAPQALQVFFNLVIQRESSKPRLGLEILGLYDRNEEEGNSGYTTPLEVAQPPGGCEAFEIVADGGCSTVPAQ